MRVNAVFYAGCLLLLLGLSAFGALVKRPYSEQASLWTAKLLEISEAAELTPSEAAAATQLALDWVRLGPCKGAEQDGNSVVDAVRSVTDPDPSSALQSAVLQMVGFLSSDNFGRGPSEELCQFAGAVSR